MLGIPLQNLSDPHRYDVVSAGHFRVKGGVYRNDCHTAFIHHGHNNVVDEGTGSLVEIGFQGQAVVQPAVDDRKKATILIQLHMLNVDGRSV